VKECLQLLFSNSVASFSSQIQPSLVAFRLLARCTAYLLSA